MSDEAPKKPLLLAIGIEDSLLDLLAPYLATVDICKITVFEPQVEARIAEASLVLLGWDGRGKRAHLLLQQLSPIDKKNFKAKIYAVIAHGRIVEKVPPKNARILGIADWVELPSRYFEIQRLIFDLAPTEEEDDDDDFVSELNAGGFRVLSHMPTRGPGIKHAASVALKCWTAKFSERDKAVPDDPDAAPKGAPLARHVTVFHRDRSFALEIEKLLLRCAVASTAVAAEPEEAMRYLREGKTDVLVVWFDAQDQQAALILEQIAETRDLKLTPLLVLVPGQSALTQLAQQQGESFFDAVAVYDRKFESLKAALARAIAGANDPDSARGILEQLRAPLRRGTPSGLKKVMPLEKAEALCATLAAKPGKRYWAVAELLRYKLAYKNFDEARALLDEVKTLKPSAFSTTILQKVAEKIEAKPGVGKELAAATLRYAGLTADRLLRVGTMLLRWRDADALADLLDGWFDREEMPRDHNLDFLAANYYQIIGKPKTTRALLAQAVRQDPLQVDYLSPLANALADENDQTAAVKIYRLALQAGDDSPNLRMRLVQALIACRSMREARIELQKILAGEPSHKEALTLLSSLNRNP